MNRFWKKTSLLALSSTLALSLIGCSKPDAKEEQKAFASFMKDEFVDTMESEYLLINTYLEDPKAYGIDMSKVKVNLGSRFDAKTAKSDYKEMQKAYEEFEGFDRDLLTKEQQDEYDAYEFQQSLALEMGEQEYDYYAQLFSSMSGLQFQLPTLFADWQLDSEEEVVQMLTCLSDVRAYVKSALDYTKKQSEKNLLMTDIDAVIEYCDRIVASGENSSVLTSIKENIDKSGMKGEQANIYKEQARAVFTESFIPAYQDISATMKEIKKAGKNNSEGYAKFENGKEYYELLVQQNIGSDKSVEDVKKMMEDAYDEYLREMTAVVMENPEEVEPIVSQQLPSTGYKSYTEILDDMKSKITKEYPKVKNLEYNIKNMNTEVASDGIVAYFVIPKMDGNPVKQLRVNPNGADPSSISTFSTVSHEGFPGHMYQYAYMSENVDSNFIKALSNNLAYTEGYAVYAQMNSLKYLEDKEINSALLDAYRLNELTTYCVIVLADIGIHYEGWKLDEFVTFFQDKGLYLPDDQALEMYNQLQANPAAFMPYYVGYAEFKELRENAETALGERFDVKEFNQAILESGTVPFEVVERHVDAYIEAK